VTYLTATLRFQDIALVKVDRAFLKLVIV